MTANVGAATPPSPSPKHTLHSTPQIASPTTPTHADHSKKGYSLEDVRGWNEAKVTEWLCQLNLSRHKGKFLEHNITGAILLDLDNDALKAMDIKTVGERVKLLVAVRSLRQECYSALTTAARAKYGMLEGRSGFGPDFRSLNQSNVSLATTFMPTSHYDAASFKHEGYNVTSPQPDKSSKSSETKSLLSRSNSFSRFLGRSDSKKSLRSGGSNAPDAPPMPPSPKKVQKRKSLEGGIMSMEKVKQTCVKVFGEEGQTRIVNVHNATDAKAIMAKVLHKFGIDEGSADRYCIFVGSSTTGEARALSDSELIEICRSTDRPEKERLILRKRHLYPTHEEFKRKGTINARRQLQQLYGNSNFELDSSTISDNTFVESGRSNGGGLPDKQRTLDIITGSSHNNRPPGHAPVRRFFGERPPSEVISSNLPSFFPNHKREVLETAGINAKRLSMTRSASISRRESRYAFRNSVLPELVSSLGIDLGKFLEEEDDDDDDAAEEDETSIAVADLDDTASKHSATEDSVKSGTSTTPDTTETTQQHEPAQPSRRSSSLPQTSSISEEPTEKENDQNEKATTEPKSTPSTDKTPVAWMKGSLIGRGTFGDVYLGMNPINGELMAVKQVELPVENSATEDRKRSMVEAMQREIALLKELQHENIVQYLGSQTDVAHFSIFLEYVPGGSVAGLLASYGAFQEPLVQSFVRQILKGLNYLHSKDIVHRDIKGANVLVDNKGGVKISDFGISKKIEEDIMQVAASSHRPSLQGSIFWMAPEVVKQTHYTRKADVWSLGCMVVEMFTGDHPFPEFSQMQAIFKIGSYTAPNIPEHISEDAKDFLRCTFKLNHEERPTAKELLEHPFSAQPAA